MLDKLAPAILMSLISALAQSPQAFDAASVKLNTAPPGGREGIRGGDIRFLPGMVVGRKVSAWRIIVEAYHLSSYQLSAGPDWLESVKFELEAKAEGPANESQLRSMLQTLLNQRFKLVMHHETREMPFYALTAGKGALKLLELREGETPPATAKELSSRGVVLPKLDRVAGMMSDRGDIQHLVDRLNQMEKIDHPVIDKTDLHGTYYFFFQWDSEENFMAEIQEQSGLKFVSQRAPTDVVVIDHIEKPDAN